MNREIQINCLITKSDYVDFKTAAARVCINKRELVLLRAASILLILSAFLMLAFSRGGAARIVLCTVMVAAGAAAGTFPDIFLPLLIRSRANGEYEAATERFSAQTAALGEEAVRFQTDRYSACVPYDMLYLVYEDNRVFIFYTGIAEMRFLPKRAMSDEEIAEAQSLFRRKLQKKYQQEGAR